MKYTRKLCLDAGKHIAEFKNGFIHFYFTELPVLT